MLLYNKRERDLTFCKDPVLFSFTLSVQGIIRKAGKSDFRRVLKCEYRGAVRG